MVYTAEHKTAHAKIITIRSRTPWRGWFVSIVMIATLNVDVSAQSAEALYMKNCAQCHGTDARGGNAKSLFDNRWQFGSSKTAISRNIRDGILDMGMPAYGKTMSDDKIAKLTDYILNPHKAKETAKKGDGRTITTKDYETVNVTTWVKGLNIPWGLTFIDANTALVTERPGALRQIINGELRPPVNNTPKVLAQGQGGMLDVAVDPNYSENGWVYLAYSHAQPGKRRNPAMTRVVRGKIKDNQWTEEQVLFEAPQNTYRTARVHYGCRLAFDSKSFLYFSIGDRGAQNQAQDVTRPNGKVHRIHPDGKIPADNPFAKKADAIQSIYSYGNRNPQGLAVHPETDALWSTEHGPMGGDELNIIRNGANYGWPVITYGKNYNGTVITELTEKEGMEQPVIHWTPSIAVCGMDFYTGTAFSKWKNHLLVTALKYQELRLVKVSGKTVTSQEVLLKKMGRVRDVAVGPDGAIYVVLNGPGNILRLTPPD